MIKYRAREYSSYYVVRVFLSIGVADALSDSADGRHQCCPSLALLGWR